MTDYGALLREPAIEVLKKAGVFIPKLVLVFLVILIGWIIAKVLEGLVIKALKMVKFEMVSEKSGIAAFLAKGSVKRTLSDLIGALVYWLLVLITFVIALNALNLGVAADLLDRIVLYIPVVIVSIFILVLGIFFATLAGSMVRTSAANAGVAIANGLGRITQIIIVVFATAMALNNLNISAAIVQLTLTIILGSLGLGLALAIGLGCKDIVGRYANDWINKLGAK